MSVKMKGYAESVATNTALSRNTVTTIKRSPAKVTDIEVNISS